MSVYELYVQSDIDDLTTNEDLSFNTFNGEVLSVNWKKLRFLDADQDEKKGQVRMYLPGVYAVNKIVKDIILSVTDKNDLEFLEIEYNHDKLWIMHVLKVVDAIDLEKSDVVKVSSGKITHFKTYSFIQDKIEEEYIFKVPQIKTRVFVTERFKDLVEKNNIFDFLFKKVWDSEK